MSEEEEYVKMILKDTNSRILDNYILKLQRKNERLKSIIKEVREYIKWHYDLATDENVEFCLLRDRLLQILDKGE